MDNIVDECYRVLDEISVDFVTPHSTWTTWCNLYPVHRSRWAVEHGRRVKDGHIYELAFDGSDAHAEIIERTTGPFLGDATDPYDSEALPHDGRDDDTSCVAGQVLWAAAKTVPQFMQCFLCEGVNSPQ